MFNIASQHRWMLALIILAIALVSAFNAAFPKLIGDIMQSIANNEDCSYTAKIMFLIFVAKLVIQYILLIQTQYISQMFGYKLKVGITELIVDTHPSLLTNYVQGDLFYKVFVELSAVQGKLIFGTIYLIKDFVFMIIILFIIIKSSPIMAVNLLIFVVIWMLCNRFFGRQLSKLGNMWQKHNAIFSNYFSEILHGKPDIFIFKLEDFVHNIVKMLTKNLDRVNKMQSRTFSAQGTIGELLAGCFFTSIVIIVKSEHFSLSQIISCIGNILLLAIPAKGINEYVSSIYTLKPSMARMNTFLSALQKKEMACVCKFDMHSYTPPHDTLSLEFQGVHFNYDVDGPSV